MDKKQIKKFLKPLVVECIKEALLEDGILSGIISEVVLGLSRAPLLTETSARPRPIDESEKQLAIKTRQVEDERQQRIKKLNESFGGKLKGVNPFEGSTPTLAEPLSESLDAPGALAGIEPADAGVDISGLQALAGSHWKTLRGDV